MDSSGVFKRTRISAHPQQIGLSPGNLGTTKLRLNYGGPRENIFGSILKNASDFQIFPTGYMVKTHFLLEIFKYQSHPQVYWKILM